MADRATAVSSLIASKVAEVNDNLGRGIDIGDPPHRRCRERRDRPHRRRRRDRGRQRPQGRRHHRDRRQLGPQGDHRHGRPAPGHPARGDHRPRRHHGRAPRLAQHRDQHRARAVDDRPRSRRRPDRGDHLQAHRRGHRQHHRSMSPRPPTAWTRMCASALEQIQHRVALHRRADLDQGRGRRRRHREPASVALNHVPSRRRPMQSRCPRQRALGAARDDAAVARQRAAGGARSRAPRRPNS